MMNIERWLNVKTTCHDEKQQKIKENYKCIRQYGIKNQMTVFDDNQTGLYMSDANKIVVYAALFGNLAIAFVKFIAAYLTNSSAMLSEAIHSVVDTLNEILLLYGIKNHNKLPMQNILLVMDVSCIFGHLLFHYWSLHWVR